MWAAWKNVASILLEDTYIGNTYEYLKDIKDSYCSCKYLEAPEYNKDMPKHKHKSHKDKVFNHPNSLEVYPLKHTLMEEDKFIETNNLEASEETNQKRGRTPLKTNQKEGCPIEDQPKKRDDPIGTNQKERTH